MNGTEWKAELSDGLLERLSVRVEDARGFPGLVREIQSRIYGRCLALDGAFGDKIRHYAWDFGRGPWQMLLRDLLYEIDTSRKGGSTTGVRESSWPRGSDLWREPAGPISEADRRERRVPLSPGLLERLSIEIRDQRGFPGLVLEVQGRIMDGAVTLNNLFVRRLRHYAWDYGKGPWQMLLRDLLEEIDDVARSV